jgi:hypothetical protein
MQAGGGLRYGAWVGCCIGPESARLKLYAEAPDPAFRWHGIAVPALEDAMVAARMVAYTPAGRAVETYLRVPSMLPEHLAAVLAPAGLAHLAGRVRSGIELLYGHALRGRLPGPTVGVSYTGGDARRCVTLHFYARAVWGGDARIRRRFAAASEALGADPARYLAVTAGLAEGADWRTRHGIVGFTVDESRPPSLTVGLRPVAP